MDRARIEEVRNAYKVLVEKSDGDHLEDLSVGGRIILKLTSKKWGGSVCTVLMWHRIWTTGGLS
jgi:hypothetical protein